MLIVYVLGICVRERQYVFGMCIDEYVLKICVDDY